ncbi:MAG: SEL1-like repeat protein [Candidatus Riflebacteria bacterium]|nr:SEL1-like repeat protein [Candidatus Riflebacteria bacterium]
MKKNAGLNSFPGLFVSLIFTQLLLIVFFQFTSPLIAADQSPDLATLKTAAQDGDPVSQTILGEIFYNGRHGVPKNPPEARKWFLMAANDGSIVAQFYVAYMQLFGEGGYEDPDRGLKFLISSCSKGYPPALLLQGILTYEDKVRRQGGEVAPTEFKYAILRLGLTRYKAMKGEKPMPELSKTAEGYLDSMERSFSEDAKAIAEEQYSKFDLGTPPYSDEMPFGYSQHVLPEGEPAFPDEQFQAWVDELVPLVEKATKRKFRKKPIFKVADRAQVSRSLALDIQIQLEKLNPTWTNEQCQAAALVQAQAIAPGMLGKYGMVDKTLYVLPRNITPFAKLRKISDSYLPAIVKIILAHELTHAMQDQQIDLNLMTSATKGPDENMAFSAAIEGHALFTQEEIAMELSFDKEAVILSQSIAIGVEREGNDSIDSEASINSSLLASVYVKGRRFIEHFSQNGGNEKIWEILAHPPLRTSMILRPETYDPKVKAAPAYEKIFEGFVKYIPGEYKLVQNVEVGLLTLETVLKKFEKSTRTKLLDNICHVQMFAAQQDGSPLMAAFTFFIFSDDSIAREYFDESEKSAERSAEKLSTEGIKEVFECKPFNALPASFAHQIKLVLKADSKAPSLKGIKSINTLAYRIVRGNVLLEIDDVCIGIPEKNIIELSEEAFKRHAECELSYKDILKAQSTTQANVSAPPVSTAFVAPAVTSPVTNSHAEKNDPLQPVIDSLNANNFAEVRVLLRPILKENPRNAKGWYLLAVTAAKEKKYEQAWKSIDIATKLAPDNEKVRAFIKRLQTVSPRKE